MAKRKKSRTPGTAAKRAKPLAFGLSAAQIAERTGLSKKTIWARYARGIRGEALLRGNMHEERERSAEARRYAGLTNKEMSVRARECGLAPSTVRARYARGIRGEELFVPVGALERGERVPKEEKRESKWATGEDVGKAGAGWGFLATPEGE